MLTYEKTAIAWAATATLAVIANEAVAQRSVVQSVAKIDLAKKTFNIPEEYIDSGALVYSWLWWLPGMDSNDNTVFLEIPIDFVAERVSGYPSYAEGSEKTLRVRVVELNEVEYASHVRNERINTVYFNAATDASEWEILPMPGYFRVHESGPGSWLWHAFSSAPRSEIENVDILQIWLGSCVQGYSTNLSSCDRYVLYEDIAINYSMDGNSIQHSREVGQLLIRTFDEWRR